MAACFRLVSPLKIQEEEQPQEKGCLMVMADPSDHGHGRKDNLVSTILCCEKFKWKWDGRGCRNGPKTEIGSLTKG